LGEGFKNPVTLRVEGWRDRIRDFLNREASPPASGIFKALVLGEQGDIPEEIKEYFILTGTAHLLAISGDQFGIVALLSFSLLIWILKRSEFLLLSISIRKWAAGLTIPCIVLYAFIAGGGISVIRAAIMVITFLVSILLDRERNLLHTLGLAAFLILILSPPSLFDVSFQLSFLAVLSILYLVPRILQEFKQEGISALLKTLWKKNIMKYIMLSLLVTAVAIIGTAPFVALHFNRFAPIGFFTNLFIVPWVGFLIVPLSLAASIFSFLFTPLATLLMAVNSFITLMLLRVLAFFASLPFASLFVSTPTLFEIILFYLLLFLSVHVKKRRMARYLFLGVCVVSVLDVAFWNLRDSFQKDLRLSFIDVGHGDSILIEFPQGKRMLIDGGGLYDDRFDTGKNVIAPFLWSRKIRRIDALVLTHPDPDHLKGLNFIASQFSIGQFWDNGFQTESESYLELRKILNERKIRTQSLNEEMPPQTINGVEISVLNPPMWRVTQRRTQNPRDMNNASLVMKLRFKNVSVLLTGDIGKEAEERMLRRDYLLRSDILKIPHHGSSSSSSTPFLERVKPTHAILSVGERNIGRLPHPEVLKRYLQVGSKILRTDKHGAITVMTDGETIDVKPFLEERE
jgi:competence protein ComEC